MELRLEELVKLANLRQRHLQEALGGELAEQLRAAEHLPRVPLRVQCEAQQIRHLEVALLLNLLLDVVGAALGVVRRNRDGCEQRNRRHRPCVRRAQVLVVRLGEVEELEPRVGVVQVVLAHPEHLGQLGVVYSHHLRLGRLLHHHHQAVDVLHAPERLLPQLELRCDLQLLEARLQVELQRLRQGEVRAVALVPVLVQVHEVVAEHLREPAELRRPLVLLAELERAHGGHGVQRLELGVVTQDLQHAAVRLPQELEAGGHELPISPVAALLRAHVAQHQVLRRVLSVEVLHATEVTRSCARCPRRLRLRRRQLQQVLDHVLERADVHLLAHDAVLDEALLCEAALAALHAQLHKLHHHLLEGLLPGAVALRGDDVVQSLESSILLADKEQLVRALERVLGLGVGGEEA
mmetsp:Transcript_3139/g.10987  ORF Transcript_3139/g.10987 Transcript_3139/m.10987 type:complete len:409 (+) Transcript_3139:1632-2858(+)